MTINGASHGNWRGGVHKNNGYVTVYYPEHPQAKNKRVLEHRLVAEKKIGRHLRKNEQVHHVNGIRDDNRPENLVVCKNHAAHKELHRKHPHVVKANLPLPTRVGEVVILDYPNSQRGRMKKIASECICCKKLFWRNGWNKKNKGFCGDRCDVSDEQ